MKKNIVSAFTLALTIALTGTLSAFAMTNQQRAQVLSDKGWVKGRVKNSKDLQLDEKITRAEVARIVCAVKGLDSEAEKLKDKKSPFSDVDSKNWANGYINTAVKYGYINGYPDKTFKPKNNIRGNELTVMLVQLNPNWEDFPYNEYNAKTWPIRFIDIAFDQKLMDDIEMDGFSEDCPRSTVFTMIYNIDKNKYIDIKPEKKNKKAEEKKESKKEIKKDEKIKVDKEKLNNFNINTSSGKKTVRGYFTDNFTSTLISLINNERANHSLKPLTYTDESMGDFAKRRALELTQILSHKRPNGDIINDIDKNDPDYKYKYIGENFAKNLKTPEEIFNYWMKNEEFKNNILLKDHRYIAQKSFITEDGDIYHIIMTFFNIQEAEKKTPDYSTKSCCPNKTSYSEPVCRTPYYSFKSKTDEMPELKNSNVNKDRIKTYAIEGTNDFVDGYHVGFEIPLFNLVNDIRKENSLEPFKMGDYDLSEFAKTRAAELAYNFSHTRPNGEKCGSYLFTKGYGIVGENIASGQTNPNDVVDGWMDSPGHRANILNPDFVEVSHKAFKDTDGTIYYVQIFGTKKTNEESSNQRVCKPIPKPEPRPDITDYMPKTNTISIISESGKKQDFDGFLKGGTMELTCTDIKNPHWELVSGEGKIDNPDSDHAVFTLTGDTHAVIKLESR